METATTNRVGFKRHLRVEVVPGEAVYLLSVHGVKALHGEHVETLAPLLDGTRTLASLLREAQPSMPVTVAGELLGRLARAGLISYRLSRPARPARAADGAALAYWDLLGVGADAATQAVAAERVRVLSIGAEDVVRPVQDACRESGLSVCEEGTDDAVDTVSLVLCDDYLAPELMAVDVFHRAQRRPWLLAKPCGAAPWVGPVFLPGQGACWSCLAHRMRAHRDAELSVQRTLRSEGPLHLPAASLAAGRAIGVQLAVLEAAKWLAGADEGLNETLYTLDTRTMRTRAHPVQRRPQCPECGDVNLVGARVRGPVTITSRPKATWAGSHRAAPLQDTLTRYRHLVSPVTGVVSDIQREDRLPHGLNSYDSGRNLALASHTLHELRGGLRNRSGGKGTTAIEAEVGALCEAVERYCGVRQGDEPVVRDTLRGLGSQAIHPNACQLYHDRQFRERRQWNTTHSAFQQVCAPFSADRPTDWTPVWSLTSQTHRMLPTSLLYFGREGGSDGPWADSNGNAAGSSLEDALIQGFLELVERDAVALWWYNRTRHPAVDLDAFDEPWLAATRDAYARMHRDIWVLDLTSDLGIPAMAAVSRRLDKDFQDVALGFGAHFDPRIALRRAVTEMTQFLPALSQVDADNHGYVTTSEDVRSWWTTATVENQPYLVPDTGTQARTPRSYQYTPRRDLRDDVHACETLVRDHGLELLVLDQTRPDVELPVVKVIVPGLRHFWARFAPGRLFDVPVSLGRVNTPTPYRGLNPIPLFM